MELPRITIRRDGHGSYDMTVNGERFPFPIAADPGPVVGPIAADVVPSVTLTLLAEHVDVIVTLDEGVDDGR